MTHRFLTQHVSTVTSQQKRQIKSISFLYDLQTKRKYKDHNISNIYKTANKLSTVWNLNKLHCEDFPFTSTSSSSSPTDLKTHKIKETNHLCVRCRRIFQFNPNSSIRVSFSTDLFFLRSSSRSYKSSSTETHHQLSFLSGTSLFGAKRLWRVWCICVSVDKHRLRLDKKT